MAQERIEIHFKPKGDQALITAIKILDVVTKELKDETSRYRKEVDRLGLSEEKRRKKGMFDTKNLRLQAGAFATLRSKLLLYSFGVGLASAAVGKLTDRFAQQEKAEKKLSVALGKNIRGLKNYASGLQEVTTFGDEEIINAQAIFAAYTDNEDQIKKATEATLDFAAAKGIDLATASDLIAKTMNSSTNALSRYGIKVEGVVGSTSRLDSITRSITNLYKGQAIASAETFSGSITQMTNAIGDANEAIGSVFAPTIIKIAKFFKSAAESTGEFFKRLNEDEVETSIRLLEELGVKGKALENLKTLKLKGDLKEVNKSLSDLNNTFADSAEAQDKLNKLSFEDNELNNSLTQRERIQGRLNGLLEAQKNHAFDTLGNYKVINQVTGEIEKVSYGNMDASIHNSKALLESKLSLERIEESATNASDKYKLSAKSIADIILFLKERERIEASLLSIATESNVENSNFFQSFLGFLDTLDSRIVSVAENFANTFGDMADITQQNAQKRIDATNAAADAEIAALRKSRRHQKKSAEEQAKIEKKIKDDAEKDNVKRREETNKILLAEFLTNQSIKVRETIMATQKAYMEAAPNPFLQGLVIAQGALAVGVIASQKPPKFATGGLVGGRRHSQGGTMIEAEQGEFVMNRSAVDSIGIENLNRMNRGGGGAINVSFNGNVLSDDFIELEAIPKIQEAIRRGAELEVN